MENFSIADWRPITPEQFVKLLGEATFEAESNGTVVECKTTDLRSDEQGDSWVASFHRIGHDGPEPAEICALFTADADQNLSRSVCFRRI